MQVTELLNTQEIAVLETMATPLSCTRRGCETKGVPSQFLVPSFDQLKDELGRWPTPNELAQYIVCKSCARMYSYEGALRILKEREERRKQANRNGHRSQRDRNWDYAERDDRPRRRFRSSPNTPRLEREDEDPGRQKTRSYHIRTRRRSL